MVNPSFQIGQNIGAFQAKSMRESKDVNAIEKILTEAQATNDPKVLQNTMGKILSQVSPERQPQAIKAIEMMMNNIDAKNKEAQGKQAAQQAGYTYGAPSTVQTQQVKDRAKQNYLQNLGLDGAGYFQQQTPMQTQPMDDQVQPEKIQGMANQQIQPQQKRFPEDYSNEELINMQGAPYREISEPAKATLQQRQEQRKEIGESYKINEKFIDKVYDQYEDSSRKDAILERLVNLDNTGQLSNSRVINALEALGFKPEWLQNPANEEYNKLALDLLGGGSLQADYGSRVLASEFKVSQQRIPSLMQTPEGRRQIIENLRAMTLPAKLKQERMQYYLDKAERTGQPLPKNLRGKILQDIKPQLDEVYDNFKKRNGRYEVKKGTVPDDNSIEKYYYISNGKLEDAKKMMREDGYDVK